jgi:hypothetical protein
LARLEFPNADRPASLFLRHVRDAKKERDTIGLGFVSRVQQANCDDASFLNRIAQMKSAAAEAGIDRECPLGEEPTGVIEA